MINARCAERSGLHRPRAHRLLEITCAAMLLLAIGSSRGALAQTEPGDAGVGSFDGMVPTPGGALDDDAGSEVAAEGIAEPTQEAQLPAEPPAVAVLPSVEPDPTIAPVITGSGTEQTPAPPVPPAERPRAVLTTILSLLLLLVLAYLGGHSRVLGWEERLGISQVITAGFPFVLLGTLARHPEIGLLSDSVLSELSPLLRLGLGWIGFVVGFRFDASMFERMPSSSGRVVLLSTALPFVAVVLASGLLFYEPAAALPSWRNPVLLRDAIILGLAGAMSAPTVTRLLRSPGSTTALKRVIGLEELAGVIGLALVAAFFRPQGGSVSWQLPGAAWLLLTIGLGTTVGLIVYAMLQRRSQGPDFLVLTLGSISFVAGAAGYLHLSSVVVAFMAGVLLANLEGTYHASLRDMLLRLERPIYLISLVIIGALWRLDDARAWLLIPVFAAARLLGKWLATRLAVAHNDPDLGAQELRALAVSPIGALSIAIVINAQLLYPGGAISMIASAVVGGGLLTEMVVQFVGRKSRAPVGNGGAAP